MRLSYHKRSPGRQVTRVTRRVSGVTPKHEPRHLPPTRRRGYNSAMLNSDTDFVIEAHDLTKKYPTQKGPPALAGLSLSIPKGQLYCLVGPDGAGKTTALRILSTVMEQTSGEARVMGCDVRRQAEQARKHIG
ncbi:MAG: ATP-binding cassette domain-containing protein, partial [Anaerolineales bacterium]|nr:ATP-binding cassette domain-containing protein [Anaerolineales bacterium]